MVREIISRGLSQTLGFGTTNKGPGRFSRKGPDHHLRRQKGIVAVRRQRLSVALLWMQDQFLEGSFAAAKAGRQEAERTASRFNSI